MNRRLRVLTLGLAAVLVAVVASACGTEHINVPNTAADAAVHHGAVLFNQRCSGCHSLNYAAANGSAPNPRIAQANSGPNFNVRCERPITRVLYAIENGGFSGAIMPQNIVVGTDAMDVAKFVATYAGRLAPKLTGRQALPVQLDRDDPRHRGRRRPRPAPRAVRPPRPRPPRRPRRPPRARRSTRTPDVVRFTDRTRAMAG